MPDCPSEARRSGDSTCFRDDLGVATFLSLSYIGLSTCTCGGTFERLSLASSSFDEGPVVRSEGSFDSACVEKANLSLDRGPFASSLESHSSFHSPHGSKPTHSSFETPPKIEGLYKPPHSFLKSQSATEISNRKDFPTHVSLYRTFCKMPSEARRAEYLLLAAERCIAI